MSENDVALDGNWFTDTIGAALAGEWGSLLLLIAAWVASALVTAYLTRLTALLSIRALVQAVRQPVRLTRWALGRTPRPLGDLAAALIEELATPGLKLTEATTGVDDLVTPGGLVVRIGTAGVIAINRLNGVSPGIAQLLIPLLEHDSPRDLWAVKQAALTARDRTREETHAAECRRAVEALTAPRQTVEKMVKMAHSCGAIRDPDEAGRKKTG